MRGKGLWDCGIENKRDRAKVEIGQTVEGKGKLYRSEETEVVV